jgi:hypothetical protein
MLNPNMRQTSLWDLRMMSAANRSETPFERGMRSPYGSRGVSGDPMLGQLANMANEPDYSQFTYDPAMNAAAKAAGVQPLEAGQVKQNTLLPNTGFFGNHPTLSHALEGGLYSLAASHGGMTPGESMQGVAEGLIGGHRIQEGLYRQQFARPFESAGMLEGLRDVGEQRLLRQAQIKHYSDEADIQRDRVQLETEKNQLGLDKLNATRPVPVEGGTYLYHPGQEGSIGVNGRTPYQTPGAPAGWAFEAGPGRGKGQEGDLDVATREQLRVAGVDPNTATPKQIATANQKAQNQKVQVMGAGAGAREHAEQPFKNLQDAQKQHDENIKGLQGKLLKQDDPQHRDAARQDILFQRITSGDSNMLVSDKDVDSYIKQKNDGIQAQIDGANAEFKNQYPQTQVLPPEGKGTSSPKRGSLGSQENPHVVQ